MNVLRTALAAGLLLTAASHALEPRTWVCVDGRVIEGTLENVQGNLLKILTNDGKQLQLDRSVVSIGDNEYIKENFPDAKPPQIGMGSTNVQLPMPGKLAKIDQRTFKMAAGTLTMPTDSWEIMETPHFKILYQKPVDPKDCGELAERMWIDAAYVHATLPNKFINGQKMAVFLAPTDSHYERIGEWYADLLRKSGNVEGAAKTSATWKQSAAAGLHLPNDIARQYNVHQHARALRAYRKTGSNKEEMRKGVWQPFWTHCLASDMIDIQAGGVSSFGSKGEFAMLTGHAFYKEVSYTNESETGLLRSQSSSGNDVSSVSGLANARNWPSELKKLIRKGEVKPTFDTMWLLTREVAQPKDNVLAYAWARYLQSTLPRMSNFNKLIQRISTSNQIPEPVDVAKIYGFDSAEALQADFQKYLASPEFR